MKQYVLVTGATYEYRNLIYHERREHYTAESVSISLSSIICSRRSLYQRTVPDTFFQILFSRYFFISKSYIDYDVCEDDLCSSKMFLGL